MVRSFAGSLTCVAACLAGSHAALAQYPSKPITVVVPTAPGGSIDAAGRLIGDALAGRMGVPVIHEFRAGAGGAIGITSVVKAAPDGHTLLFSTNGVGVDQAVKLKPAYDPLKDLRPITIAAFGYLGVLVNPKLPVNSLPAFIAYAKANPGKLNYGHPGVGSYSHLASEVFRIAAGVDTVAVPYKGGAPTIPAAVAGDIQYVITDAALTRPQWQSGKLTLLAVGSPSRRSYAPDIPTVAETLPGYDSGYWYGYFAPAGTPDAVFGKLEAELTAVLNSADLKQKLGGMGLEASGMRSDQFRKKLEGEIAQWKALIPKIGITPE